jgi:hypothetical protein
VLTALAGAIPLLAPFLNTLLERPRGAGSRPGFLDISRSEIGGNTLHRDLGKDLFQSLLIFDNRPVPFLAYEEFPDVPFESAPYRQRLSISLKRTPVSYKSPFVGCRPCLDARAGLDHVHRGHGNHSLIIPFGTLLGPFPRGKQQ